MPDWVDGSLIVGLIAGLCAAVSAWFAIKHEVRTLGKRMDALHARVVEIAGNQHQHEKECAERWGRSDGKLETLEKQLDTYTDARMDRIEEAVTRRATA